MARIIAITHDPDDARNRCTAWLAAAGHDVVARCPAAGESIPAITPEVAGAVIFGGRFDVNSRAENRFLLDELNFIDDVLTRNLPFLGICLGAQLLAHGLGSPVDRHPGGHAEYGYYDLEPTAAGRELFGNGLKVLQSHWHGWSRTPDGAVKLAASALFPEQAFRYGTNAYGLQFHPEATRATLEKWIGRRPAERHLMAGAFPPDRQLADNLVHDVALARWFERFLASWIGPAAEAREAAE